MARVKSIVVELTNGRFRTIHLDRARSIYIGHTPHGRYRARAGEGGMVGPETDRPHFEAGDIELKVEDKGANCGTARGAALTDDGDDGPQCYFVNGVWICDG
jgi:hypothetical protein